MLNITTNHAITYTHLLREYLIIFVFSMSVQSQKFVIFFSNGQYQCQFEEYPDKSGIPTFPCFLMSCVITVFSVTSRRKTRFKNGIHSFVSQVISVQ